MFGDLGFQIGNDCILLHIVLLFGLFLGGFVLIVLILVVVILFVKLVQMYLNMIVTFIDEAKLQFQQLT
jgi:hypothetical protein